MAKAIISYSVSLMVFLSSGIGNGKELLKYQTAKVLSLSEKTVTKSQFTGESFGDVTFMTSQPYKAVVYDMTLEIAGVRYCLIYEPRPRRDYVPQIQVGDLLEVRIKADRIFIKRPDGKEWKPKNAGCPNATETIQEDHIGRQADWSNNG